MKLVIQKFQKDSHANAIFIKYGFNKYIFNIIRILPESDIFTETFEKEDEYELHIYHISRDKCMSLILSQNILISFLFKDAICIKDTIHISGIVLSSIKPILHCNKSIKRSPPNELCVKFHNIQGGQDFISTLFLPIIVGLKTYLQECLFVFQFAHNHCGKDIEVYFYFKNNSADVILLDMQKYLYENSFKFKLSNIIIPHNRKKLFYDDFSGEISEKVIYSMSWLLTLDMEESNKSESQTVTNVVLYYLIFAKCFYSEIEEFIEINQEIFNEFSKEYTKEMFPYILSNEIYDQTINRLEYEYYNLSITNANSLLLNYKKIICDWNDIYIEEYNNFIKTICTIKTDLLAIDNANDIISSFFKEYTKVLFHNFDISSYYKSYIPYIVKFVSYAI